ncbi:MAG: hypothetical protein AAF468_07160 [Pseudomonadota bacterium]
MFTTKDLAKSPGQISRLGSEPSARFRSKRYRTFGTVLALVALVGLAACDEVGPKRSSLAWNYKITLNIETPDGPKSAHSVIGVKAVPVWMEKRNDGYSFGVEGEATPLKLPAGVGKGRQIFMLLRTYHNAGTVIADAYGQQLTAMGAQVCAC